jgi:putative DNA methylase
VEVISRELMKKKLIEVALPLEAINKESAREKSIRHGHPSTLHLWWARRPLAACRAVLFASLVDDPSSLPEQFPTEEDQDKERQRLFRLIEKLVLWENSNNRAVLDEAYAEILKSTGGHPPPVYDPFCGGGSIPLEAQRLGLEAHGSDLNPIAVLITKALIEIPPKFAGQPPVNPTAKKRISGKGMWTGARGLADDVRYYGQWIRDRAVERIGHLYPAARLPSGEEAIVIACLWARTVECPNPACGARMPLVRSFALSTKPGRKAWIDPVIDHVAKRARFEVRQGEGAPAEGTKERNRSRCLFCKNVMNDAQLRAVATTNGFGAMLMAVVAEGTRGRVYLNAESCAQPDVPRVEALWLEQPMPENPRWFSPPGYGLPNFRDLFTPRQLVSLTAFSDLVTEAREQALTDGASPEYGNAIATYLGFGVDKLADRSSSISSWDAGYVKIRNTFGRQAIPMTWDFAEGNPFSDSTGNWTSCIDWTWKSLEAAPATGISGIVRQLDATTVSESALFSTDPPYYDNIGYADLSDFFYLWLRRSIGAIYPDVCSTLLVPKKQELVATPYRFEGSRQRAQEFFKQGFGKAFTQIRLSQKEGFPMTVYYAFKQSETDEDTEGKTALTHASTGWETMLEGLLHAGFQVTGTWPLRSELSNRMIASGTNALASSIVLACRPRPDSASITTRKDFLVSLKRELPSALRNLQKGNIAPVDLAQAAIGPGMGVFSRYQKVLETDGSSMRVRTALALINQGLDEVLSEFESEFDPDTRWALAWFEQHQFDEGLYGEAEVLATAKALSISHLAEVGLLHSRAGKVRLLRRNELSDNWEPSAISRLTVWEVTQHLIRCLDQKSEQETANLKAKIGGMAEIARDLAYRLYTLCERKGWAEEAGYYNSLVVAWPSMASEAFELQ